MDLGQEERKNGSHREVDMDEAKQIQSHLGEEEVPRDKEVLPSLRKEMDWPATLLCPASRANLLIGWNRNICVKLDHW